MSAASAPQVSGSTAAAPTATATASAANAAKPAAAKAVGTRTANKIILKAPKPATAADGKTAAAATMTSAATAAAAGAVDPHGSFEALDADAVLANMSTIQSLCMNCHAENGETNLLLTRIPYFRDVIIMSFICPECHYRSNEIQPANAIAETGIRYELKVDATNAATAKMDLNRQIIKSESATLSIPNIEFEIPPTSKRGEINTLEGYLFNIAESLEQTQPDRRAQYPEIADKVQAVIDKVRSFAEGKASFTFCIDDPAGNSFVENPYIADRKPDPRIVISHYHRTPAQQEELGYLPEGQAGGSGAAAAAAAAAAGEGGMGKKGGHISHSDRVKSVHMDPSMFPKIDSYFDVTERAANMPGPCPACQTECDTRMCIVDVPYFKDIILMVTQCDRCGYRDSEVKPAGEVSEQGVKVTLKVTSVADLKRDLLKSDSAGCTIPELDLELQPGTLGGKYTTLEGLFNDIKSSLTTVNPFFMGDSSESPAKSKMGQFIQRFDDMLFTVAKPFHIIIDDPMGNSFIENKFAPKPDPNLTIEKYTRTFEQDEELGLNDIRTENYNAEMMAEQSANSTHAPNKPAANTNTSTTTTTATSTTAGSTAAAAAPAAAVKPSSEFSFPSHASSKFETVESQVTFKGSAPMVGDNNAAAASTATAAAAAAAPVAGSTTFVCAACKKSVSVAPGATAFCRPCGRLA